MIYNPIGRETIAGVAAAIGFSAAHIPPTDNDVAYALVQPLTGAIRFCIDGTTPEAAVGVKINIEDTFEVWGRKALVNFLAIDDGGVATIEVIYFGRGG